VKRALVTGATGCIGQATVRALLAAGWSVRGLARSDADWPEGAERVRASVEDAVAVREAAAGCDAVIHLAGWVHRVPKTAADHDELRRSIVEGTRHVVEAAGRARFVFASTVAVYGSFPERPTDEGTPPAPDSAYGEAKLSAELVVRDRLPQATILRIAVVYGPRDRGNVLALMRAVDRGQARVVGPGDNRKSVLYADNLADRIVRLVEQELPGTFNAADDPAPTQRQLVDELARALGKRSPRGIPRALVMGAARLVDVVTSGNWADRVRKLAAPTEHRGAALDARLGYAPRVSFAEGIRRAVAWYRQGS